MAAVRIKDQLRGHWYAGKVGFGLTSLSLQDLVEKSVFCFPKGLKNSRYVLASWSQDRADIGTAFLETIDEVQ